ncbi:hypothetical protein NEDG_00820 [Nematocida displodere]|uniref:Pre-mRNA polyadenylation factor Fip1 domain-containing protein n=1 Tax=Nematocida displodere TaxID=1805483 RepID=A0A177ECM6_9MICR|nr:hypothetical protein NEDG_00820 [Nematocida displodere]
MQGAYIEEERDSSEDFEITLNDEQEAPPEATELLDAHGIDCDTLQDKPWKKPGEDITDYFNYGFNETTWREYIQKQKKLREEYTKPRRWEKDKRETRPRRR